LANVLGKDVIIKLAKECGVIERERKLTALSLVGVLLIGCENTSNVAIESLREMCMYLKEWYGIEIKEQSLQEKINTPESAEFIKKIMNLVINCKSSSAIAKALKKKKHKCFSLFNRILLQDSTVISLPETLSRMFPGCGGAASKAAIKIDFIIDQITGLIIRSKFVSGKTPDSRMSADVIDYLEKGDLVLRDLGYFNQYQFLKMNELDIEFISRLSICIHIYEDKNDAEPINIDEFFKDKWINKEDGIDIIVYMGKTERIPVRLVAIKVPKEVNEVRNKKFKEHRKKEASDEMKEWNGYTIMITNIKKEKLSLNAIIKLYKIRWQIELFFKNIKSNLNVDAITGENKYRIKVIIYIKVTQIWILSLLYAYAQAMCEEELSLFKFTKWLKQDGRLRRVFRTGNIGALMADFEENKKNLCKQRKRKNKPAMDIVKEACEIEGNRKVA
jgi:hypothetical protein